MVWTPSTWPEHKQGPERSCKWFAHIQGDVVEIYRIWNWSPFLDGNKRGVIKGFSRGSRLRMLKSASRIDWAAMGKSLFVTLTYPDECVNPMYTERTKKLYLFHRYVEKHLDRQIPVLWRTEWKPRLQGANVGKIAPHHHLILGGIDYIHWSMIRMWWNKINHHTGYIHTWVRKIYDASGPIKYVCKYMSKEDSFINAAYLNNGCLNGKAWSLKRRHLFPMRPVEMDRSLTFEEVRVAQQFAQSEFERYDEFEDGGFTLLGNYNKKLFQAVLAECS